MIFSYLSPEKIALISQVSREWHQNSNHLGAWKHHLNKAGFPIPDATPSSWSFFFKEKQQAHKAALAILALLKETHADLKEDPIILPDGIHFHLLEERSANDLCYKAFKACFKGLSPRMVLHSIFEVWPKTLQLSLEEALNCSFNSGLTLLHFFMNLKGEPEGPACIQLLIENGAKSVAEEIQKAEKVVPAFCQDKTCSSPSPSSLSS